MVVTGYKSIVGRAPGGEQVVKELVATYADHDQWFREEVAKGIASLDAGDFVPHDEVRRHGAQRWP